MNDQTAAAPEVQKTVIRPDLKRYVRAKSGAGKRTHRTDDFVARSLDGKTVEEVVNGGAKLGIDTAKWGHLNPGQQRMLTGNALRHRMVDKKDPLTEEQITAVFGEPTAPYDAEAEAAKAAAKAAEAAEKAAAKAAAAAAAAATPAENESQNEASGEAEAPEGKGKKGKKK